MDVLSENNSNTSPEEVREGAPRVLAIECCDEALSHLSALRLPSQTALAGSTSSQGLASRAQLLYSLGQAATLAEARALLSGFDVCVLGRGEACEDEKGEAKQFVRAASAAGVPIIVLAEAECPSDDQALLEAGAVDYLVREHINGPLFERALRYAIERKRVEGALRSSEERFHSVTQSSPIVIATTDEQGVISYINDTARTVFGYEPHELVGANLSLLLSPSGTRSELLSRLEHQEQSGGEASVEPSVLEVEGLRRDGSRVALDVALGVFQVGSRRCFSVLIRDLSQKKAAEAALQRSEDRLSQLAANVPGVVYQWKLDTQGRVFFTFLSEGAADVFGKNYARLVNFDMVSVIEKGTGAEDRAAFWESVQRSAREMSPWKWLERLQSSSGEIWLDCRARPTAQPDGSILWDGMMLDVTAHMGVEEELRRAQAELEARVERRTRQLALSNEALQSEVAERKQAEAMLRTRARQQEAIADLSQHALQGAEMSILLRGAASLVAATLDVEVAAIVQDAPQGERVGYGVAWNSDLPQQATENTGLMQRESSVLGSVLDGGQPAIIKDWAAQDRFQMPEMLREKGLRSSIYAPIPSENGIFGVFTVHSTQAGRLAIQDMNFVTAMAHVLATVIDRRRMEDALTESRARLQAVLNNTSNMIYLKDLSGRYVLTNHSLEQVNQEVHPDAPPILGSRPADFLAEEAVTMLSEHDAQVLASGQACTFEETFEVPEGLRYFLATKFPLFDQHGAVSGIGGIATDITERKSFELAREAAHTEADKSRSEAESARREAERARAEADRANAAKSEFLSRMSHELRTPLNAILGFAQLLEISSLPDRAHQGVGQILKAGRHLLSLINEVLDIARIESGKLTTSIEPVGLSLVLEEVVGLISPLAIERHVQLHLEGFDARTLNGTDEVSAEDAGANSISGAASTWAYAVMADRQRLIQVLLNLIANAVKYNREGGHVRVGYGLMPRGRVRITVADNGRGIAPEKLERLWVPFDRLDAEKSGVEGTGLGLALSRALAESMNGQLHVESSPNQGSTFWLELSLASSSSSVHMADAAGHSDSPGSEGTTGTVLHIEDNPSNLLLVESILKHRSHLRLVSSRTGEEGVQIARSLQPDVVLLDLDLPDIHGLSVLENLRQNPGTQNIPVVIVSADATRSQITRLKESGALDYLTKPLDVARLLHLLDQLLEHKSDVAPAHTSS